MKACEHALTFKLLIYFDLIYAFRAALHLIVKCTIHAHFGEATFTLQILIGHSDLRDSK